MNGIRATNACEAIATARSNSSSSTRRSTNGATRRRSQASGRASLAGTGASDIPADDPHAPSGRPHPRRVKSPARGDDREATRGPRSGVSIREERPITRTSTSELDGAPDTRPAQRVEIAVSTRTLLQLLLFGALV